MTRIASCVLRCLVLELILAAAAAAQQWPEERQVGSLHYHADYSLAKQTAMVEETALLAEQVPSVLEIQPHHDEIRVFLFHNQATFRAYVRQYFPDVPMRRALYIKPRGPGMVFAYLNPALEEDLRHETTHAVLHTMLPMVPLWLDEGLAEYFEVPAAQRQRGHSHWPRVQREFARTGIPSLRDLEEQTELSEMDADDYRHAWAWVHFLMHGPETVRAEFRAYLRDIQNHVPPGRLSERLARTVPDWSDLLVQHFQP